MEFIESKCLQKGEGKKLGIYLITLSISDYDIEQFEDFGELPTCEIVTCKSNITGKKENPDTIVLDHKKMKYMRRVFNVFRELWNKYDKG